MNKYKIYLGIIISFIICFSYIIYQHNVNKKLSEKYEISKSNEKTYSSLFSSKKEENRVLLLTNDVLEYTNDSILTLLNDYKKSITDKNKKIDQLLYFKLNFGKKDTIKLKGITDTLFKNIDIDTSIFKYQDNKLYYTLYLKIKSPDTLIVEPKFKNDFFIALSHKKETINPPKKLFFLRWFLKKQWVLVADVKNKNPWCEIETLRLVQIVK